MREQRSFGSETPTDSLAASAAYTPRLSCTIFLDRRAVITILRVSLPAKIHPKINVEFLAFFAGRICVANL